MHFDYAQCKQKGFAPVFLILGLMVLALIVPMPEYKETSMACPQVYGRSANCTSKKIWVMGKPLFKIILNSLLQPPAQVNLPTPTPTPTQDETANWKTYTSTSLGVTFKYPSALQLEDLENSVRLFNPQTKNSPQFSDISLKSYGNPTDLNIDDYVRQQEKIQTLEFSTISIGGLEGKRTLKILREKVNDFVFYKREKQIYQIELQNAGGSISSDTFDQILSTFKFIQ